MNTPNETPTDASNRLPPFAATVLPPPSVPTWWTSLSWGTFVLGAAAAFASLFVVTRPNAASGHIMADLLFASMAAVFLVGTVNTVAAGLGFSGRKRRIDRWIKAAGERIGRDRLSRDESRVQRSDCGSLSLRVEGRGTRHLRVAGEAMSGSSRGSVISSDLMVEQYRALLDDERVAPRQACARMAAALGGIFVVSLQTLSVLADRLG